MDRGERSKKRTTFGKRARWAYALKSLMIGVDPAVSTCLGGVHKDVEGSILTLTCLIRQTPQPNATLSEWFTE